MNKFKRTLAGLLSFVVVMGIAGCNASEGGGGGTTVPETEEYTVDLGDITLPIDDNKNIDGAVIDYIGTYNPINAGDIKPAYTYFKETYNATMEVKIVPDGEIMEKLASLIQGGDSPDLVDQRANSFPYYIGQNSYMPLDDYIDMDAPHWAEVKDYIDRYAVNGKHYYYPWNYYVGSRFLIYNRGKFQSFGIKDPKELYDNNEWTWDTFAECIDQFVTKSIADVPNVVGMYGSVADAFIDSTGTPLVSFKDNKLVSNLNNANVDRAQSFLENLKKQGFLRHEYGEGYNNVAEGPIIQGYAAFQAMGDWKITDYSKKQAKDPTLDIFFVPFPRDPNADKYYMNLNTFAYLVPNGAKDVDAACTFINCVRLSKTDPELMKKVDESILKEKKYTEEQYDFWKYFFTVENFESDRLVLDFAYHLDDQTCTEVIGKLCDELPLVNNDETITTWTAMRTSFEPILNDSINTINSDLEKFAG